MASSVTRKAFTALGSSLLLMAFILFGLLFIIAPALAANIGCLLFKAAE